MPSTPRGVLQITYFMAVCQPLFAVNTNDFRDEYIDKDVFRKNLQELETSGFYYRNCTSSLAETLLKNRKRGSFLVRDSSSTNALFTLSYKNERELVRHIRIGFTYGRFSLQINSSNASDVQREQTVVRLIQRYVLMYRYRVPTSIYLKEPVRNNQMLNLQHLCRLKVNNVISEAGIDTAQADQCLGITNNVNKYIQGYPYII